MDRRNFLSQSFVTMGTYAISVSSFATLDIGGLGTLSLRSGVVGQKEFEQAVSQATRKGRTLVIHPQSRILLTSNVTVGCSVASSGGHIEISPQARVTFSGPQGKALKVKGVHFKGEVLVKHEGPVSFENNTLVNSKGDGLVIEKAQKLSIVGNNVKCGGHGIVVLNNNDSSIHGNSLEVSGIDRQFVWAENSFNLEIKNNSFINKSSGHPSVAIANDHDQNPNLTLKNNKIA